MKMLEIKQTQDMLEIYDETVCIYQAVKEEEKYILKNAYQRKVAMLTPIKESFSLFQDKKKNSYDVIMETRNIGVFHDQKNSISITNEESLFTLYSGRMMGKDILIGYENKEFIFQVDLYENKALIFLKQPEYAAYASLYSLYFISNNKQYSDSSTFLSHLPEDMMSFVS